MFSKSLHVFIIISLLCSLVTPVSKAHADSLLGLPAPGTMINLSPAYEPVMIKGLTVHKDNPFLFDFIVDVGQDKMSGEPLKKEGEKLIKYFLASLAIPDKDVWVNLSPYEKSKMIPKALGQTDMGRDLLEQDYILKQITASLIYPEKDLGKKFWDKVYAKAQQMYGTTQIPVNTFNKVWIMADRAEVFEHNQTAFVVDSHLKVMLEEDYLALQKHSGSPQSHTIASQIVKQIILPELEKEVNTGKNFANLRQILNSLILANWYKNNLKQALLNQVYTSQSNVKGIDLNDPTVKEQIYEQYLKAYKKGVFNYIKEDVTAQGESIPRKYFSGGFDEAMAVKNPEMTTDPAALANSLPSDSALVDFTTLADAAMSNGLIDQVPDLSNKLSIIKMCLDNLILLGQGKKRIWPNIENEYGEIRNELTPLLRLNIQAVAQFYYGWQEIVEKDPHLKKKESLKDALGLLNAMEKKFKSLGVSMEDDTDVVPINLFPEPAKRATKSETPKNKPQKKRMVPVSETPPMVTATISAASTIPQAVAPATPQAVKPERAPGIEHIKPIDHPVNDAPIENSREKKEYKSFESMFKAEEKTPYSIVGRYFEITYKKITDKTLQKLMLWIKGINENEIRGYLVDGQDFILNQFQEFQIQEAQEIANFAKRESLNSESTVAPPIQRFSSVLLKRTPAPIIRPALPTIVRKRKMPAKKLPAEIGKIFRSRIDGTKVWVVDVTAEDNGKRIIGLMVDKTSGELTGERKKISGEIFSKDWEELSDGPTTSEERIKIALAENGGIDLNTSNGMQWRVNKDGNGVEMNVDPAMIERIRLEGIDSLSPVILRMTPITNIWSLAGLPKK